MTRVCLSALFAHWRRSPLLLFTFLTGLAIATALWSGVQAINAEARASYDAAAATLGGAQFGQLRPRAGDTVAQDVYIALRRAGWQVSPVLEGRIDPGGGAVRIVGLDPLTAPAGIAPAAAGGIADLAEFLSPGLLFANAETAARFTAPTGPRVIVDPDIAPGTVITDIGVAQDLLDRAGRISRFIVADVQPRGIPPLEEVAPDLTPLPAQPGGDVGQMTDSFHLNLTAFGLLSFAVGIFIVHGAIGLAFDQRRALVRTLRTLGVPLRRLIVLIVAELLCLALLAGTAGVLLGYLIAALLLPDVAATLDGLYGAQVAGGLQLRPSWWLSGLGIAVAGTAVAAGAALVELARTPLLPNAAPRALAMAAGRGRIRLAGTAFVLLSGALAISLLGDGLVAGFALLGCLLIGAALTLPVVLDVALALCQRNASRALGAWFWADTRQQLPRLSLALMALLLAIATNVGVSTMVSSFRTAFLDFLDQRLTADLYLRLDDPANGPALEAFLAARTTEILPRLFVETRLAGRPAEVIGLRQSPVYAETWVFIAAAPDAWDRLAAGDAVLASEQLARRSGLWLGDTLTVGPGTHLSIAGIYSDYGNPLGQATVSDEVFRSLHPDLPPRQFGVRAEDPAALRRALVEEFGMAAGDIIDQGRQKAVSRAIFERTFTVTGALNALTLAVAGFAMLISMMTLAALRLPQLAPVWALGQTRARLCRLELIRSLALAAFTAVLAVPLGLVLAWVLLSVINVKAFGWLLPMYLFPVDYARIGLLAMLAAVLAAVWPAIVLMRTPPSKLLEVFASER